MTSQPDTSEKLNKEEPPLASALKCEITNYEQALLKLRVHHRNNLWQILEAFSKRGMTDNKTALAIKNRLEII